MANLKVLIKNKTKRYKYLYKFCNFTWHYSSFIFLSILLKLQYPKLKIYGKKRGSFTDGFRSDYGQDFIMDTFARKIKENKFFLDIGCNHPENISNSYYLEKSLGFKGIAIDAINTYENLFKLIRPETKFLNFLISNKDGSEKFIHFESLNGWEDMLSAEISNVRKEDLVIPHRIEYKETKTINTILRENSIENFSILLLDIEGLEFEALQGLDFFSIKPKIVLCENVKGKFGQGSKKIRDLMISKGYLYFARIWRTDDLFLLPEMIS